LLYPCFIQATLFKSTRYLFYQCVISMFYQLLYHVLSTCYINLLYPCFIQATLFKSTRYLFYQCVISMFYQQLYHVLSTCYIRVLQIRAQYLE
jgi:hypothetical protein